MKAMVLARPGQPLAAETRPDPRPSAGEIMVRMEACAVCRTDLHVVDGELPNPALPIVLSAVAVMALTRSSFEARGPLRAKTGDRLTALGGCAFGIYLLQGMVIIETRHRVFDPLRSMMNPLLAALIWEAGVFLFTLAVAWVLKRISLLKKLL